MGQWRVVFALACVGAVLLCARPSMALPVPIKPVFAATDENSSVVPIQWGGTGWGSQPQQQEDANLRVTALEERLRQLTGQIEQLQFQIRRLEDQLKRFQEDTEYRFQEAQGAGGGQPAQQRRPPSPPRPSGTQQRGDAGSPEPTAPLALTPQPGAPASGPSTASGRPALGAPPQVLGQVAADPRTGEPLNLAGAAGQGGVSTAALATPGGAGAGFVPQAGNAREAFDQAYGYVLRGEYDRAEAAFQYYLATFPNDRHNGDGLYWLGESQFQRQQWKTAAESFLKSYNDHPTGAKAPESLLRLGMSLRQLGQKEAACASFAEVLRKYPRASPAVKQRVQSEQRGAACV